MKKTLGGSPAALYAAGILMVSFAVLRFSVTGCGFLGYTCLLAALVILCLRLFRRISAVRPVTAKVLRAVFLSGLFLFLAVFAITEYVVVSAAGQEAPNDVKAIVVLGAGLDGSEPSKTLLDRLRCAETYLEANREAICIVTGAQGKKEEISEAEAMYRWLTAQGIDESRILKEEQATNTYENIAYSEALLTSAGISAGTVGILTSEYHMYRAELCAKELGMNACGIPAKTSNPVYRVNYFIREALAVWYYVLFK